MILMATVTAAYTGRMDEITRASFDSAKAAVTLAIGLIGPMALWLGLMKVAEAGGLLRLLARGMRPLMTRLFPEVPPEHPAMSAMIMNLAANALGLGNAATPMGIKAMQELDKLAAEKGHRHQCHVPVPGDQHLQRHPSAPWGDHGPGRGRGP